MKIKKNISTLALAGILTVGSVLPTYAEEISSGAVFKDLEENKWYTEAVSELSEKGVLKVHNGLVRPHDNGLPIHNNNYIWKVHQKISIDI